VPPAGVFRLCRLLGGLSPPRVLNKKCGDTPQKDKHERKTLAFAEKQSTNNNNFNK